MTTTAKTRVSPGAVALEGHVVLCSRCRAVAIAGQSPTMFCAAGRLLAVAALRRRIRRAS